MSKKPRILMDIPNQKAGIKSVNIPSYNLNSHFKPFKSKVFEVDLRQLYLQLIQFSGKKGIQFGACLIPMAARTKKTLHSTNSNFGAVFGLDRYDALNTPILSFRP